MKLSMKYMVPVAIALLGFFTWKYFFETLSFSELVGRQQNPRVSIMVNLFDFDTSLTRYDVDRLKRRSGYWARRIDEVNSIQDSARRQMEKEKLLAEMLEDPSMKKIARKTLGISADALFKTVKAISGL